MEIKKFIYFCGIKTIVLFFLFISGCTTGNCRSQIVKKEQAGGVLPLKENKLIPIPGLSERVKVYKPDGTLQCAQGKKIPLDEMVKQLGDIKVYNSFSDNDGMMRIQLCGSPTGNSNVYEIDRENLKRAVSLGFKEWLR